jgi:hypothetical protein
MAGGREELDRDVDAMMHTYNTVIKPAVIKAVPRGFRKMECFLNQ